MKRTLPEEQGIPSQAIADMVAAARELSSLHSVMVVRNGCVVAEGWWDPYGPSLSHWLFSLSKSVTSLGVGLAEAEGLLTLDDPVTSFFPDDLPETPGPHLLAMRVEDLLRMTHGHEGNTDREVMRADNSGWARSFLAIEPAHKPGSSWQYNNNVSYMLSAIVQRVSGERLVDYLTPRLFEPLGCRSPVWDESPEGVTLGASGLRMTTDEVARFGQLCLQLGQWRGTQLVPESWIRRATAVQATPPPQDSIEGYGYHFAVVPDQAAYVAGGVFGQNCIVLPEKDALVVTTAGVRHGEMQSISDMVWKHLAPSMADSPLQADDSALSGLSSMLSDLAIATVSGSSKPPDGLNWARSFQFESNDRGIEEVTFDPSADGLNVTITTSSGRHLIRCNYERWQSQVTGFEPPTLTKLGVLGSTSDTPCAANAAWKSGNSLGVRLCYTETPFVEDLDFEFTAGGVTFQQVANLSLHGWDARQKPTVTGSA
jgi:CubicO group peptidase (beta-lactamase class C family)